MLNEIVRSGKVKVFNELFERTILMSVIRGNVAQISSATLN